MVIVHWDQGSPRFVNIDAQLVLWRWPYRLAISIPETVQELIYVHMTRPVPLSLEAGAVRSRLPANIADAHRRGAERVLCSHRVSPSTYFIDAPHRNLDWAAL